MTQRTVTPEQIAGVNEWIFNATAKFVASGAEVVPIAFGLTLDADGKLAPTMAMPLAPLFSKGPAGKDAAAKLLREILDSGKYDAIVQVNEAWSVRRKDGDSMPTGSLADEQDRGECVLVIVRTPAGAEVVTMHDITRNPSVLHRREPETGAQLSGRFMLNRVVQ